MSDKRETRDPSSTTSRRDDICIHIFTVSATLVGVCLTVVGVLRVVPRLRGVHTFADDVVSADAVAFLAACATAYGALRSDDLPRRWRLERAADLLFLIALAVMALVGLLIATELI